MVCPEQNFSRFFQTADKHLPINMWTVRSQCLSMSCRAKKHLCTHQEPNHSSSIILSSTPWQSHYCNWAILAQIHGLSIKNLHNYNRNSSRTGRAVLRDTVQSTWEASNFSPSAWILGSLSIHAISERMCPEYRFRIKWGGVMASSGTPLRCSDSSGTDVASNFR